MFQLVTKIFDSIAYHTQVSKTRFEDKSKYKAYS